MKDKRITLRVSDADWQTLHEKATAARMTLTDYLTACGLQKEIVIIDGLEEVIRQQKGVSRNLNQLTTLANMGKVNVLHLKELTDAYALVSSSLSEILKRRRWR
jgi:archaellum biogenesis ATPase FlaH